MQDTERTNEVETNTRSESEDGCSQLTRSGSGSDLNAKVETTLIAYSSVMAEDQDGLLDISAKSTCTFVNVLYHIFLLFLLYR